MIRACILSATIAALFCLWLDRPKTSQLVQVSYCWVTYKVAGKDEHGKWHSGWGEGFGPCKLLDRYENI